MTLRCALLHDAYPQPHAFRAFRHQEYWLICDGPQAREFARLSSWTTFILLLKLAANTLTPNSPSQHFSKARLNMSGITESTAGTHATRQPSLQEKEVVDDILCLYQLKPSDQAYSHYAENAVFHDPVSIARGLDSIKSQFNGMPKVFAESITESTPCAKDIFSFPFSKQ
jgi:hypothetical protein